MVTHLAIIQLIGYEQHSSTTVCYHGQLTLC